MKPDPDLITPEHFATPHLLIRSANGDVAPPVRAFAALQARQAQSLLRALVRRLHSVNDLQQRATIFAAVFGLAEQWRYRIAASQPHSDGRYSIVHAQRFGTAITDAEPNYIPLGEPERYRDGAVWDAESSRYTGGAATPASQTMSKYADLGHARFGPSSDDLVINSAQLPDGSSVDGMRLLRGAAAAHAGGVIAARIAARGGDTSRCTSSAEALYVASAREAERRTIFRGAMAYLAGARQGTSAGEVAWVLSAYLLYQAPRRRRGSDATVRTFLVAAGLLLVGRPPVLPHDLDLLAYVHTQDDFLQVVRPWTPQMIAGKASSG